MRITLLGGTIHPKSSYGVTANIIVGARLPTHNNLQGWGLDRSPKPFWPEILETWNNPQAPLQSIEQMPKNCEEISSREEMRSRRDVKDGCPQEPPFIWQLERVMNNTIHYNVSSCLVLSRKLWTDWSTITFLKSRMNGPGWVVDYPPGSVFWEVTDYDPVPEYPHFWIIRCQIKVFISTGDIIY